MSSVCSVSTHGCKPMLIHSSFYQASCWNLEVLARGGNITYLCPQQTPPPPSDSPLHHSPILSSRLLCFAAIADLELPLDNVARCVAELHRTLMEIVGKRRNHNLMQYDDKYDTIYVLYFSHTGLSSISRPIILLYLGGSCPFRSGKQTCDVRMD